MRPLEIIIIVLLAVWMAWPLPFGLRRPWGHLVAVGAAAVTLVHLAVESWRWQMVPAYLVVVVVFGLAIWDWYEATSVPPPRGLRSIGFLGLGLLGMASLALLPALIPVFSFPDPGGRYPIGTVVFELVDGSRVEAYGPEPGGPRRLMLQVWYPAHPAGDAGPARWSPDVAEIGPVLADDLGLPGFFFDHARLIDSHAVEGAAVAAGGPFPVVVYSHGWTGFRTVNLNQSEALASRGFVVAALDHTHGAIATVFPDGTVAEIDGEALPDEEDVGEEEYAARSMELVATFSADLSFLLDQLEILGAGGEDLAGSNVSGSTEMFAGHLDLGRLGAFGHSTGGGAVVDLCSRDGRCTAGVGMDAWVEPVPDDVVESGSTQPFLYLRSEDWTGDANDRRLRTLVRNGTGGAMLASIDGAAHNDFTVAPLFSPIASWIGLKGPIDGDRVIEIVDTYLIDFFAAHLQGRSVTTPDHPEVTVEVVR